MTTDHDEIRRWAEEHGERPVLLTGRSFGGGRGLRLIKKGEQPREESRDLEWDEFFRIFDHYDLALVFIGGDENEGSILERASAEARLRAS